MGQQKYIKMKLVNGMLLFVPLSFMQSSLELHVLILDLYCVLGKCVILQKYPYLKSLDSCSNGGKIFSNYSLGTLTSLKLLFSYCKINFGFTSIKDFIHFLGSWICMYVWKKTSRFYLVVAIEKVNSKVIHRRMDIEVHFYLSQLPSEDRLYKPYLGSVSYERSSFQCLFLDRHQQNPSGGCSLVWRSEQTHDFKNPNKQNSSSPKTKPPKTEPTNKTIDLPNLFWLSTFNSLALSARILSCCAITNGSEGTGLDIGSIKGCLTKGGREFMAL